MFGWIEKLFKIPAAIFSAKSSLQREQHMEPVRRFVHLFEAHSIARSQIPGLLSNYGVALSLSDIVSDDALLNRIDESMLNKACDIFGIRREWIDGVDDSIYEPVWFYKNLKSFIDFMENIHGQYDSIELYTIKSPDNKLSKEDSKESYQHIAMVIRCRIGSVGDKEIYRYIPCNDTWIWSYWKSRYELKGLALVAWQFGHVVFGINEEQEIIDSIIAGEAFPGPYVEKPGYKSTMRLDYMIFTEKESGAADDPEEAVKAREYLREIHVLEYLEARKGPIKELRSIRWSSFFLPLILTIANT